MNYKKNLYFSIFLFLVLGLVSVLLWTYPLLRGVQQESRELRNKETELASAKVLSSGFKSIEKNYQFYRKGLQDIKDLLKQESLVDPEIPVNFINFLKEQATQLDISLKIFPLGVETKKSKFWNYLDFRIEGAGQFNSLMQFIEKLEYSHWFIEVTNFSLSRKGVSNPNEQESSQGGSLRQFNLLIRVYAQK